jgi:hypothetical protein
MFGIDIFRSAKKPLTGRHRAQLSVFVLDSDIISRHFGDRPVLLERPPGSAAGTSITTDFNFGSSAYEIWVF